MPAHVPQVGAPDPEKRTSPILDEDEEEQSALDLEREAGVCYFNVESYPTGAYVQSGRSSNRGPVLTLPAAGMPALDRIRAAA